MAGKIKKSETDLKNIRVGHIGFMRLFIGALKVRIFGIPDPLYEKVVLLNKIKKDLKKIEIKGINLAKDRMTPDFGNILFDIYRIFFSLRKIIEFNKPNKVKEFIHFTIKKASNEKQAELIELLNSEKYILETMAEKGTKAGGQHLKDMYKDLSQSYHKEQIKKMNHIYSLGESLYQFLKLDLFVFLKKLAPDFKEENITVPPSFREIDMRQIDLHLKEFTDHVYSLNVDSNYYEFVDSYSKFIGKEIIPQEDFQNFMNTITKLVKSNYLMLLVQYVSQDVYFRPFYSFSEKSIFTEYMKELAIYLNQTQSKALDSMRIKTIEKMLLDLFGMTNIVEMTSYTAEQSEFLIKNNIGAFSYVEPMNVLKKFLMDKYNRYIRTNLNTLIVKSTFTQESFREHINTLYYAMNSIMDKILEFENKLKENDGWDKIVNLVRGRGKDSSLAYLAKKNMTEYNQQAREIIDFFIENAEGMKEKTKEIVEAYNKGKKEPISDLKTFAGSTSSEVVKNIAQSYNDINKVLTYFKIILKDS